ncbi:MAG TPA: ribosome maturation factor RimM [Burkholderiaceae bacterium]|jgi:16S rRNA processing protein RimM|nr:ribosome maturation factor RimM [Burkholderiaceae bacterium]
MTAAAPQEDLSWPEDAIEVGRVLGAWGIKGGIKVLPFAADPQALISAKRWFLKPAESAKPSAAAAPANVLRSAVAKTPAQKAALAAPLPVALHVKGVRDQGDAIVCTAPEIPDRDAAEAMKGVRVFVSRATFPKTDDGEFYWVDLIGLAVVNREQAALGEVVGLIDTGPHCVLRVRPADPAADERLIPFVEAYVDSVDMPGRRILVDWGLDF